LEDRTVPSFLPAVNVPVGQNPLGLATRDFNGDGNLDFAVADQGSDTVSVLLGNGDGTFQPRQDYPVGSRPDHLVAADLTGNGILDLAVTNNGSDTVSVLLGNGDGTFQSAVNYAVGHGPAGIAVCDFNGDGRPDLVVANFNTPIGSLGTVSVLLGNGDGTFQTAQNFTVGLDPRTVRVADVNGDGILDLVTANTGSNSVSVLLGNGDGTFRSAVNYAVGQVPVCLQVADINGDGTLDLTVENFNDNSVSVLFGTGDGTFQNLGLYHNVVMPNCGLLFNITNLTGFPDLVTANNTSQGTVSLLVNNGDGTFQSPLLYQVGANPISLTGGSFTGSGLTDVIVSNNGGSTVSVLINDGQWSPPRADLGHSLGGQLLSVGTPGSGVLGGTQALAAPADRAHSSAAGTLNDGDLLAHQLGQDLVFAQLGRGPQGGQNERALVRFHSAAPPWDGGTGWDPFATREEGL
jgi:hypothetical protein